MKIITRHPGAIAWIKSKGYDGEVISQFESPDPGETYIGTLPLLMVKSIIDAGGKFILLSLPAVAFSDRGAELTPAEMELAGATLHRIKTLEMELV